VSCGRPSFGTRLLIVDPATLRPCRDGETGEIWVAGPGVARGYWNRPEENVRIFRAFSTEGDGPFLRTGDLGFVRDGELYVTGRLKDVLIVRGVKHYPQDLEYTAAQQHPAIRPDSVAAFATARQTSGDLITLVAEADPRYLDGADTAPAIIAEIRRAVADMHGVQLRSVVLAPPGVIPKTTSGKLQRFACRERLQQGTLPTLVEWRDSPIRS